MRKRTEKQNCYSWQVKLKKLIIIYVSFEELDQLMGFDGGLFVVVKSGLRNHHLWNVLVLGRDKCGEWRRALCKCWVFERILDPNNAIVMAGN